MRSSPGDSIRPADEQPHQVTISRAFYMQATEVTNAQFQTQHPAHAAPLWLNTIELNQKNHPAIYMSWNIAEQFCRDLATPIDKMQGHYRLPTEAEWEWACRAEATTATPWGDSTKDVAPHANFLDPNSHSYWSRLAPTAAGKDYIATQTPIEADDGHLGTAPVRSFAPNRWGLYDMLGNAAEWCQDWYSPTYPDTPQQDPMGPVSGQHKVSRGGGFYSSRVSARSSSRSGRLPLGHKRSQGLGFRLVFAPSTLPKKP